MANKKLQIWLPLLFSIVMIAGMFFGAKLHEQTGAKNLFKRDKRTSVQEAMDIIRLKYVDSVGMDSLQDGALHEMMNELDPHSVYIPASTLDEVNEDLAGNFQGIGVEFNIFEDTVNILNVVAGGPSEKAGLQIGDKIIKVNDEVVAGKRMDSDAIKKRIKGPGGSTVLLTLLRNNKSQAVSVTRGTIPIPSLDAAYMVDKTTGYIRLNKFSESTYEEFMSSLEALQQQGLKKLILDLRNNGGGLMNEAVDIADEFLADDKLVVYTEGTNSKKREYRCKRPGLFETGELVLLVDELSASASEVLAGALQDWDRATIVGRRTFGKGLVQEQYTLSDGSAIRLTTARYFTPAGRSIQRPYDKGKKIYMDELWDRYNTGEMIYADSNKVSNGKTYETIIKKRKVYGGGGIMPDEFVAIDTSRLNKNVGHLYMNGTLSRFVYKYYIGNLALVNNYKSPEEFSKNYTVPADVWAQLTSYAAKDSIDLKQVGGKDKEEVLTRFKANLARSRWRNPGYFEVINAADPAFKKAMSLMSQPAK